MMSVLLNSWQLPSMIFTMECAVALMVIGTILSPSLTTPSAGKLSDFFPSGGMCDLSTEERIEVLRRIQNAVPVANAGGVSVPQCGPGPWLQIADFDIATTTPECPPEWPLFTGPPDGCRRPVVPGGCSTATFSTGGVEYNKVCGRIIADASGNGDANAFGLNGAATTVVDGIRLVDGVTITHFSSPIQHIWTLAASTFDTSDTVMCPCSIPGLTSSAVTFAGQNYFCDTTLSGAKLLWNGMCSPPITGDPDLEACCNFNQPPYFSMTVARTNVDVEAHLCRNQGRNNEDILVQIIELYVQLS